MKNKPVTWQERRAQAIKAAALAVLVDPSADDESVASASAALKTPTRSLDDAISSLDIDHKIELRDLLARIVERERKKGTSSEAPQRTDDVAPSS